MSEQSKQSGQESSAGDKLRDNASKMGEQLRDMGGQVRDAAREKYEDLRRQAGEYYEEGRDRAMEWEQGLEEYVQQKPVKSLLIAAGVGLLLGMIIKRS